jgi:hypothetical protein
VRKSSNDGYNDLVPYSHADVIIIDGGEEGVGKDIAYCGCNHYPCKTISYGLDRTDTVYLIIFFFFLYCLLNMYHFFLASSIFP